MDYELKDGINTIFKERGKFIILGLTGRTGSGCTTTAKFLSMNFQAIDHQRPKISNFENDDERKYKIICEYAQKNWKEFYHIRIRDIITSFILEYNFDIFCKYCFKQFTFNKHEFIDNIPSIFISDFRKLHKDRKLIMRLIKKDRSKGLTHENTYNFYFRDLSKFTDCLEGIINSYNNGFIKLYQSIGNNIRNSGEAYNENFNPLNIFRLSQRTNTLIKILRQKSIEDDRKVFVVIDALRNPFEINFFRERYAAFYLMSITTDNNTRIKHLREQSDYSDSQIEEIDKQEYPDKPTGYDIFTSQNIQKCIEMSDIHIYNPDNGENDFSVLKRQILKYVVLIMHPGLITPSKEERCMQIAYNAKFNSGCISRQVGAVVTDEFYSLKAVGWNNPAEGQVPCLLRSVELLIGKHDRHAFSDYEIKNEDFNELIKKVYLQFIQNELLQGRTLSFCFKDLKNSLDGEKNQVYSRALHGEENAFLQLSKYGGSGLKNGILFSTASPCELCSKKAYQIGIKKIYYIDPYPGIANDHILKSGKNRPELYLFQGVIGRAYQQLYEPIISYKDELEMLLNLK